MTASPQERIYSSVQIDEALKNNSRPFLYWVAQLRCADPDETLEAIRELAGDASVEENVLKMGYLTKDFIENHPQRGMRILEALAICNFSSEWKEKTRSEMEDHVVNPAEASEFISKIWGVLIRAFDEILAKETLAEQKETMIRMFNIYTALPGFQIMEKDARRILEDHYAATIKH